MKKAIVICTLLLALLVLVCACTNEEGPQTPTTAGDTTKAPTVITTRTQETTTKATGTSGNQTPDPDLSLPTPAPDDDSYRNDTNWTPDF